MLSQLYIKNIAVIQEASIELGPGFNVFTGETGAGKTILVSAINGVLGARLSKDLIRAGEDRACLSALFTDIPEAAAQRIEEMGYETEEGSLLITREMGARNSCKINGRPATLQILRDIASLLIDIHGQKDNQKLMQPETHLGYIDDYGQLQPVKAAYQERYDQARELRREIDRLSRDDREKEHQMDLLNYQINEIQAAGLEEGEEEALLLRRDQIRNAEQIVRLLSQSRELLEGGEEGGGISQLMEQLCQNLTELGRYLPQLQDAARRCEEMTYELSDWSGTLGSQLDQVDYQPDALDCIEERLDTIHRLKRKYGSTVEEILAYEAESQKKLEQYQSSDDRLQELQNRYAELRPRLLEAADALTAARHRTAREFLARVKRELEFLNMPSVKLSITAARTGLKAGGQDQMEFLISSNAGEDPKPLAKIASGGELSRVMLSIKNVLAEKDQVGTAIFDEIDTGVSGKAAQKIGQKLAQVSRNRQVLCVTHLAQVAAFGDHHLVIQKQEEDGRTFTRVRVLSPEERVEEIARIVSGENLTGTAMQNAREMLELAHRPPEEVSS